MSQLAVNARIGALEIDVFGAAASRHDDGALESAGRPCAGWQAEPQPFTQIGFPPPCNVMDDSFDDAGR